MSCVPILLADLPFPDCTNRCTFVVPLHHYFSQALGCLARQLGFYADSHIFLSLS